MTLKFKTFPLRGLHLDQVSRDLASYVPEEVSISAICMCMS